MGKGITRARTGLLLQELFRVLAAHPDGMRGKDAILAVASRVELTEHEAGEYQSGGRRFDKILRFSTVDAVKAGWMRKDRGVWSLTEKGTEALTTFPDPEAFYQEVARLYRKWRKAQPLDDGDDGDNGDQQASVTFEEAEEQAWQEITEYLQEIDPYDLQELVAALLEAMEYHVSWISPPGKDGGLDIVAYSDPLGTKPPRIKVQVKRRKDAIGVEELRSFLALVNEDDVGIFVTTGGFSKDATQLARLQERRRLTLIDQVRLVELWIQYQASVPADKRDALPLQPIYFLAPED
jgi:restriction system protein